MLHFKVDTKPLVIRGYIAPLALALWLAPRFGRNQRFKFVAHDPLVCIVFTPLVDVEVLGEELEGQAQVLTVDQAVDLGLFGRGEPHPRLRSRAGNTMILPYDGHHVWYHHLPHSQFELRGHHGGLTEAEMLVPLVVARLSDLLA